MTYREWEMFSLLNRKPQMEELGIVLMGEAFPVSLLPHLRPYCLISLPTPSYIFWQDWPDLRPPAREPLAVTALCEQA